LLPPAGKGHSSHLARPPTRRRTGSDGAADHGIGGADPSVIDFLDPVQKLDMSEFLP